VPAALLVPRYLVDVASEDGIDDAGGADDSAGPDGRARPDDGGGAGTVGGPRAEAAAFAAEALARGHEGVVVKSLAAPYAMGRRGSGWIKVKPRLTLDLVVLAAEWGHGRRTGYLSNLHLGARDPEGRYGEPGGFVMLGKTFKGLTDVMLVWQTERLQGLATSTGTWRVDVRPELVVEIAFDGVQTSPRYPAGMALRFARVLAHRPDKPASQADTIDTVRRLHDVTPDDATDQAV
jgi:DNA ligase-1